MSEPRDRRWLSFLGLSGGLAMFVAEALIVVGLVTLAWLTSVLILSVL